jgi:hypothetical protein
MSEIADIDFPDKDVLGYCQIADLAPILLTAMVNIGEFNLPVHFEFWGCFKCDEHAISFCQMDRPGISLETRDFSYNCFSIDQEDFPCKSDLDYAQALEKVHEMYRLLEERSLDELTHFRIHALGDDSDDYCPKRAKLFVANLNFQIEPPGYTLETPFASKRRKRRERTEVERCTCRPLAGEDVLSVGTGWVYILINTSIDPSLLKIGMTTKTPEERAAEISSATGVPTPYIVAYEAQVKECARAERLVHEALCMYRVNARREFFQLPLKVAVDTVNTIVNQLNRSV